MLLVKKKHLKKLPYNKETTFHEAFPKYSIVRYGKIEVELLTRWYDWVELSDDFPIKIKRIKKTFFEKILDIFKKV